MTGDSTKSASYVLETILVSLTQLWVIYLKSTCFGRDIDRRQPQNVQS